jgi:hypothetical protein
METMLASINTAKTLLAQSRDLSEILNIRDQAVAIQAYASARGADEAAMIAMEVKLRAERKAGQFLANMKKEGILSKGGNPNLTSNKMLPVAPTLKRASARYAQGHSHIGQK